MKLLNKNKNENLYILYTYAAVGQKGLFIVTAFIERLML